MDQAATIGVRRLVVLGGAGDLAVRHLLPGLARLLDARPLAHDLEVVAVDRRPLDDDAYRALVLSRLDRHAGQVSAAARQLLAAARYVPLDLEAVESLPSTVTDLPALYYLALPVNAASRAVQALASADVAPGSRVLVEKPFGTDGPSAAALDARLVPVFGEHAVHRVDHFLHHQAVQELVALRLQDGPLAQVWSRESVSQVDVVWDETGTAQGRASFYDQTGALRDMIQSHLLQLLAAVALDGVDAGHPDGLRDARAAVLSRVRPWPDRDSELDVRARYAAGSGPDGAVPAYVDEPGVDPARATETFVRLRLAVDADRWRGVPFVLRTGKALRRSRKHVELHLRPTPGSTQPSASLRCDLGSDRLVLRTSGSPALELPRPGIADGAAPSLPASARLLADALRADTSRSVRADELASCWGVVDDVRRQWAASGLPLGEYPAGSDGPG